MLESAYCLVCLQAVEVFYCVLKHRGYVSPVRYGEVGTISVPITNDLLLIPRNYAVSKHGGLSNTAGTAVQYV